MKTQNKPILILAILAVALSVSACGKTNRSVSGTSGGGGVVTIPPISTATQTFTNTSTSTSTSTNTSSSPPLSYEFTLYGNQAAQTPEITTDNVLKVKFRVTPEQGNVDSPGNIHRATELKVTIAMNGTEVTPQYTSDNYSYGLVGETSNVIDLSSYVTPGVKVKITVKNPASDFYCTYWGGYYWDSYGVRQLVNPLYNSYPGCRKAVNPVHKWGGVLIVQTSSTQSI